MIKPDGAIYVEALNNYEYMHLEWDVYDEIIQISSLSSSVTSIIGGIGVCDKYCAMSIDLEMTTGSNAWETIFTIPAEVRPATIIRPFIYSNYNKTGYVRDSNYDVANGNVSMWRSNYDHDKYLHVQASWLLNS